MDNDQARRDAGAAVFAQEDVAASYHARPPYAPALFEVLLAQTAGRARALDIGCGPGKVARVLADHFGEVVALDPSAPMIAAGQAADAGAHDNITWVQTRAEDYDDPGTFDLAIFGCSLHWTDPAVLFPKLARWTPLVAVLNDAPTFPAPAPPCGHDAWIDFLAVWFECTGRSIPEAWRTPDSDAASSLGAHDTWLDVAERRRFTFRYRQSVEDFIAGNHARMNWNRRMMGPAVVAGFDAALDQLMRAFVTDGMLTLDAASELISGAPRMAPRPTGDGRR